MRQFQKNRIVLLEELKDLVTESLSVGHEFVSRDVRRRNLKLKAIRKELSKWINEATETEKLLATERRHDAERRKKADELRTNPPYGQ